MTIHCLEDNFNIGTSPSNPVEDFKMLGVTSLEPSKTALVEDLQGKKK